MEQPTVNTNSGSTAGFSGGATASTPVAGFDPCSNQSYSSFNA